MPRPARTATVFGGSGRTALEVGGESPAAGRRRSARHRPVGLGPASAPAGDGHSRLVPHSEQNFDDSNGNRVPHSWQNLLPPGDAGAEGGPEGGSAKCLEASVACVGVEGAAVARPRAGDDLCTGDFAGDRVAAALGEAAGDRFGTGDAVGDLWRPPGDAGRMGLAGEGGRRPGGGLGLLTVVAQRGMCRSAAVGLKRRPQWGHGT